jgi:hypothetical protein
LDTTIEQNSSRSHIVCAIISIPCAPRRSHARPPPLAPLLPCTSPLLPLLSSLPDIIRETAFPSSRPFACTPEVQAIGHYDRTKFIALTHLPEQARQTSTKGGPPPASWVEVSKRTSRPVTSQFLALTSTGEIRSSPILLRYHSPSMLDFIRPPSFQP